MQFENQKSVFLTCLFLISFLTAIAGDEFEEERYGVKYATPCEVCKIMVEELEQRLEDTGKEGGVLETGYHLDKRLEKKKNYKDSELQLIESIEKACDGVMDYKIHKERSDSTRFARGQSQTFSTLQNLVAKGVKVDLGIPYELWDKPSAEISHLKTQCDNMMERYESDIEDWFLEHKKKQPLKEYLCKNIVLKKKDYQCLYEKAPEVTDDSSAGSTSKGDKHEL